MKGVTVNDFIVREKNKVSSDYCAKSIIWKEDKMMAEFNSGSSMSLFFEESPL